jgi:hypothetical protein
MRLEVEGGNRMAVTQDNLTIEIAVNSQKAAKSLEEIADKLSFKQKIRL